MPLRLSVLASGSAGNATYFVAEREGAAPPTRLLVDAGLAPREVERRRQRIDGRPPHGASPDGPRLDALFLTHEHGDHADHAADFAALGVPVYATAGTQRALDLPSELALRTIAAGETVTVGALEVTAVALPHDAEEPVGYVVSDGASRAGVLTDLGWADPAVAEAYAACDLLVLETNHDPSMLVLGPYLPGLKRRIAGPRGHLSNREAATLLLKIYQAAEARTPPTRGPRLVVLAHLSKTNNKPGKALAAVAPVLRGPGGNACVVVATQGAPTPWLDPTAPLPSATLPGEQLLFSFPSSAVEERQAGVPAPVTDESPTRRLEVAR